VAGLLAQLVVVHKLFAQVQAVPADFGAHFVDHVTDRLIVA